MLLWIWRLHPSATTTKKVLRLIFLSMCMHVVVFKRERKENLCAVVCGIGKPVL